MQRQRKENFYGFLIQMSCYFYSQLSVLMSMGVCVCVYLKFFFYTNILFGLVAITTLVYAI